MKSVSRKKAKSFKKFETEFVVPEGHLYVEKVINNTKACRRYALCAKQELENEVMKTRIVS